MTLADAPTLIDRINEARARIEALERASGAAVLDAKPVPVEELNAARANLAALEAADAEDGRRRSAAEAAGRAVEHAEARRVLEGCLGDYTAAVERAESSAKAMVEAFADMGLHAGRMRGHYRVLGKKLPNSLEANQVTDDQSRMLRTVLLPIARPSGFGCMKWNSAITVPDWTAHARKVVGVPVQSIIEGN